MFQGLERSGLFVLAGTVPAIILVETVVALKITLKSGIDACNFRHVPLFLGVERSESTDSSGRMPNIDVR